MRRSILTLILLGSAATAACGGTAEGPAITLSMTQALSAEVVTIQLGALDGSYLCNALRPRQTELRDAGICVGTTFVATPPCMISRATLEVSKIDLESAVSIFVPAGSRTITALGLDANGDPVAFACAGPLTIEAGKKTPVDLELK